MVGCLPTKKKDQDARWAENFKDVLNRPPPTVDANSQEAESELVFKILKKWKTGRQRQLNTGLFEADPKLSARILKPLFTIV